MPKLTIRVLPNASKSEIISRGRDGWRVRLAAPPVDGKANEALIRLLADEFNCAPSSIRIVKGQTGKIKVVETP
ncbi:MAG: hypothetical protein RL141_946 [Candidatus Parcubacteria bacterium]|jgi:uncharacterized protein (TIGR00251 family)